MTQSVAQSWLVFRLTGHAVDLGLLGIVTWGPVLVGAAWGGALADRLDRRHLMMATQALFIVVNVVQAGLVASGRIQLWMIFTLGALNGAVMAVDSPVRQVYVFQLVGRQRLASAVGLFEVVINAARVLGPATGGILLAAVGTAPCFAFNAASYLPMLWILWFFKPDPLAGEPQVAAPARGGRDPGCSRACGWSAIIGTPVRQPCPAPGRRRLRRAHGGGQAGNSFFTPLVGGTVQLLPPGRIYAGGVSPPLVLVELKLPDIGLADPEARAAFIAAATGIVRALARPGHRDEDTWINILHARDGSWGVGGRVLTNDDLVAGIMTAVAAPAPTPPSRGTAPGGLFATAATSGRVPG